MKAPVLEVVCLTLSCWFKEAPEAPKTIWKYTVRPYLLKILVDRYKEMTVDLSKNHLPCNLVFKVPEGSMQYSGGELTTDLLSFRLSV